MSRTPEQKKAVVNDLKQDLSESQLAVVIDYQGLSVAEIGDLRGRLRTTGTTCKVAKNTLMGIAVDSDQNWQPMQEFLTGPSAFLFVKDGDLGGAIKAYQDFQRATRKTAVRGGVMEGRALSQSEVSAITELPSKEELMARIAGALNANTAKLAVGINTVPTQLGIGVREVPASLGRALKARSEQEDSQAA
ncbi:MAG: 50S ribosomal protein L10 [Cyanobacteria bacterium QH_8_48_120]|jgi:large subunit ribosomal protein L10|nr:MAG: 50S ribosomal protein L10 [Cyanobacteria bacterium QH_1_48_107]PSO67436.1 MAG: 50S ribosomal protein L10 [Cyanobacteria bacterium QH_6_48_35]PSO75675.1 MAG: 50S ribosomal protein L10 [Cyanobacteria bacterium QH_8_48_120]PSP00785.1 MAG: 50S ribosomal protein L10 [Cyanobacteria bacterium QS_7_48_42]PSP36674.1 MAG: 50S ribosomal protein L10 [Cyanobacteria bacterium QS_8_48_54]